MNPNETIKRINAINDNDDTDIHLTTRQLLIAICNDDRPTDDDIYCAPALADELTRLITALDTDPYARDALTTLALDYSLCPMHFIDFAICFDDDDPTCAQIRSIFPYSHDT